MGAAGHAWRGNSPAGGLASRGRRLNALVTGGAGFIGRHLVAELLANGASVRVIDNLSRARPGSLNEFKTDAGFLGLVTGDVEDPAALDRAAAGINTVFHLAASVAVGASVRDPAPSIRSNVLGSLAVLELARRTGARLVLVSTCHVYAPADRPQDEGAPTQPTSPYAASKLAADELALAYHHSFGIRLSIVRPFNTYGPWQRDDLEGGVVARFIATDLAGGAIHIHGDGTQTRDFVYVTDCARGIAASAREGAIGHVVNLATGVETSIAALARRVASDGARVQFVPHPHPDVEVSRYVGVARLAQDLLGWSPRVTLAEGLRETRMWFATATKA